LTFERRSGTDQLVGGIGNTVDGRSVGQGATTNTGAVSADAMSTVPSAMAK
jgi:hypothetical protein